MALTPILTAIAPQIFDAIKRIIDDKFPNTEETVKQEIANEFAVQVAQIKVNETAAMHPSLFVAGWRSFIGWGCGIAIFWHFFGMPQLIEHWSGVNLGMEDLTDLWLLVTGLLGTSSLRTYEKFRGVARHSL